MKNNLTKYLNQKELTSIGLTFDMDWAPDYAIEKTIDIINKFNVKATFFCTNESKALMIKNELIELAIHPNFNKPNADVNEEINRLRILFPDARGVRSHCLVQSTPILDLFAKNRMKYDCNLLLCKQQDLKPFKNWNSLLRIPYTWEDDIHISYKDAYDFNAINLYSPGLKIFDFHPIHLVLNTNDLSVYHNYKNRKITNKDDIKKYISDSEGIYDFFIRLLQLIKENSILTYTLSELYNSTIEDDN